MKNFRQIILGILLILSIFVLGFGIDLLLISGIYWLLAMLLGFAFSWRYALAIIIIVIVVQSFLKGIFKNNKNN